MTAMALAPAAQAQEVDCTIGDAEIAFGSLGSFPTGIAEASGEIDIDCDNDSAVTQLVTFTISIAAEGASLTRVSQPSGAPELALTLFEEAGCDTPWTGTIVFTQQIAAEGESFLRPICAQLALRPDAWAGPYSTNLQIQMSYSVGPQ